MQKIVTIAAPCEGRLEDAALMHFCCALGSSVQELIPQFDYFKKTAQAKDRHSTMVRQYTQQRAALVLMNVAAAWLATTEAATSCKMLSDHDSTLAAAIKDMTKIPDSTFNELPLQQVFGEIDAQIPWLSTCAASIDPSAIAMQAMMSTTLSECSDKIFNQQWFPESFTNQSMKDVVCPVYQDTIVPCIIDGIVDIAVRAMKNSDGCCDPMISTLQQWFGNDIPTMVDKLLQYAGNLICSTKTTKSSSTPQYCALAVVSAFSQMNVDIGALNFGQIPNSQVCDALAGKAFVNTVGV
ncbi:hypothetical protein FI667_g10273, partial [Globisporangium splendens]